MIHHKRVFGLLAGFLVLAGPALVTSPAADPVIEAIERMDDRPRSGWAFVRTVTGGGQTQVARHDPRLETSRHGWTLEQIDGKAPNEKDLAQFHEQVDQTHERTTDDHAPTRVANLVDLTSLTRVSTNRAGQIAYSFSPTLGELPEDQKDVMAGTLVFDPTSEQIHSLSVRNTRPYSPKFAVKVAHFDLQMTFVVIDGHVVPTEMNTRFQGKAFLKPIDEELRISFSDYEWTRE